jgi:DNA invertase Pin-like site-specific DNA recombinase
MPDLLVPVAQYLRVSTEHQRYSMENQSEAIQGYASDRGFGVVRTYSDSARSGLAINYRPGLKQLLQDVMSGEAEFKAILVYDISRWGRFQDIDESAHYEFLCKSSGVPVHYCAETFVNNRDFPNMIMKVLKRTMAGEYSRELGVKVLAGQKRLAHLGFKQGGVAGYGLRRMLVSPDRQQKQELSLGQRKNIASDRVILVPGPANEVQVVREIYRMLIDEGRSVYAITRTLNERGVPYQGQTKWNHYAVYKILTHPKYEGVHVFARTSSRLASACVRTPNNQWVVTPGAFAPIVEHDMFAQAKEVLQSRTINQSNEDILRSLRELLASEGRLSLRLIKQSVYTPSPSVLRARFGGLRRAYELIGYAGTRRFNFIDLRNRTQAIREQFLTNITTRFPDDARTVRNGGRRRTTLWVRDVLVSVLVARSIRVWKSSVRWVIDPGRDEAEHVTLLVQMDERNQSFQALYLLPSIGRERRFYIKHNDNWLNRGIRLLDLAQFCDVVMTVAAMRPTQTSPTFV